MGPIACLLPPLKRLAAHPRISSFLAVELRGSRLPELRLRTDCSNPMRTSHPFTTLLRCLVLASTLPDLGAATDSGVIAGHVSNVATGKLLEGARVEVPQLQLSTLTDNTGRFVLGNVPAGTHEVVASYIGLDPLRTAVTVTSGARFVFNFDPTTEIYTLQ